MDRRAYEADWKRKQRAKARDVLVPACADLARRQQLEADTPEWLSYYLRDMFFGRWTVNRREMVQAVEFVGRHGGQQAISGPRGDGKTTIVEGVALKMIVTGVIDFMAIIAASGPFADRSLENIKYYLETSDELAADYPEVCVPIRALEGANNRAQTQTVKGKRTWIRWAGPYVVLPTVEESRCSGAVIETRGIDAAIRGMKRRSKRPRFVLVDDPDTRESAASVEQTRKRELTIENDIAGLGGDEGIGIVMLLNVLNRSCLGYRFTDRRLKPAWKGRRFKLVEKMPTRTDLWDEYMSIRRAELIAQPDGGGAVAEIDGDEDGRTARQADQYYLANREAMDEGAVHNSPERYKKKVADDGLPSEYSAIQNVYNLIQTHGWEHFLTEYQGEPPELASEERADGLTEDQILSRGVGLPRLVVPEWATMITVGVDVGKWELHWIVVAWGDKARSAVIEYGTWSVKGVTGEHEVGLEFAVRDAVKELLSHLEARQYARPDGQMRTIDKVLVDGSYQDDGVYAAVDSYKSSRWAQVCKGDTDPGTSREERYTVKKPDNLHRPGHEWLEAFSAKKRHWIVLIHSNYWKRWIRQRLATTTGQDGSMELFAPDAEPLGDHKRFAFHILNEVWDLVRRRFHGRSVNHFGDALYYCAVAASMEGISLMPSQSGAKPVRYRTVKEMQELAEARRRDRETTVG